MSRPSTTTCIQIVDFNDDSTPDDVRQLCSQRAGHPARSLRWLDVLHESLGHAPYLLVARENGRVRGYLPLALVRSVLFGRYLVSLPYVNSGGLVADDEPAAALLIEEAIRLADRLNVDHLELRHERPVTHQRLNASLDTKVHMRLRLPDSAEDLWNGLKPKVRNQVRKGQKQDFQVRWGRDELLEDFYDVFARNMRDLGTPVFCRKLFERTLAHFGEDAEFCCLRLGDKTVAAALLLHGAEVTEVPSASALREFNRANANMCMYWNLLERSVERGSRVFDFGRSTIGSSTHRFKKQWGAEPHPAHWQYHVRRGSCEKLRRESGRFDLAVRLWRRLPVPVTRWIGPPIVRGIP